MRQEKRRVNTYGRTPLSLLPCVFLQEPTPSVMSYLFEPPTCDDSWKYDTVISTLKSTPGYMVAAVMCRCCMGDADPLGKSCVKTPTGFMTNRSGIAKALDKQCSGYHCNTKLD